MKETTQEFSFDPRQLSAALLPIGLLLGLVSALVL